MGLLNPTPNPIAREQFLGELVGILGDTRVLWTPKPTDTTTSTDESLYGRTVTWDATIAARLNTLGLGYQASFNGTSQFGTAPSSSSLDFGNSAVDSAFSVVVLANVTDTAAQRSLVNRWAAAGYEWRLFISSADTLNLTLIDASIGVQPSRSSAAPISQGAMHLFGATYDGTGGATAMNGVILYQDGIAISSTASNQATYVAIEAGAAELCIGADADHAANFGNGTMALVAICKNLLAPTDMWQIKKLVNAYFGLAL